MLVLAAYTDTQYIRLPVGLPPTRSNLTHLGMYVVIIIGTGV